MLNRMKIVMFKVNVKNFGKKSQAVVSDRELVKQEAKFTKREKVQNV